MLSANVDEVDDPVLGRDWALLLEEDEVVGAAFLSLAGAEGLSGEGDEGRELDEDVAVFRDMGTLLVGDVVRGPSFTVEVEVSDTSSRGRGGDSKESMSTVPALVSILIVPGRRRQTYRAKPEEEVDERQKSQLLVVH